MCVILVWSADVERMIVSTSLDGNNGINSERVVEPVQYVDCSGVFVLNRPSVPGALKRN